MITINNQNPGTIIAAVIGEFTLADFQEMEKAAELALKFDGKAALLVDLSDMLGFTVDVAWEEIKFARQHPHDFEKIAIVTDDQWVQWSAWLTRLFTDADIQLFDDYVGALAWVQSSQP